MRKLFKVVYGLTFLSFMTYGIFQSQNTLSSHYNVSLDQCIAHAFPTDSELGTEKWYIEEVRDHFISCSEGGAFACTLK